MYKGLAVTGFFLLFSLLSATAQPCDSLRHLSPSPSAEAGEAAEAGEPIGEVESSLVTMRRGSDNNSVVLEVAGFGITLSGLTDERLKQRDSLIRRSRVNLILLGNRETGFNILTGLDYGAYPAGTEKFFDIRAGKSFHFSTLLAGLDCELGKRRRFGFSTGLQYTVDNYRLTDNSITLRREQGLIMPVTLDEKADKSKLRITSLGIPLNFTCKAARHLEISLSGYFDFTMGANSIYKKPKVKSSLSGVNTFRFSVGGAVTYHTIGLYARYSVTPLFASDAGPKVRPLSVGIYFSF